MIQSSRPDLPEGHPPIPAQSVDSQRMGWRDVALWGGAGLVMLAAHAAGAYALRELQPVTQIDGVPPAAIMMELAPVPMAPMAEEAPMLVPEVETEQAAEEPIEPEEPDVAEPVEEIQPETPPQEIAQAEPVEEIEQPEMERVPDVVEAEKPEVVAPKPVEKPKVVEKPKPKVEKPKVVEKAKPKKQEKPKPVRKAAAPQVDAAEGPKVAANRNSDTSGDSGRASNKWQAKVLADVRRQKRYAERQVAGIKGRVPVNFSFDALGNVLSVRALSGDPALARVAEEMVRRASPIPAPPPAITQRAITVPIVFQ